MDGSVAGKVDHILPGPVERGRPGALVGDAPNQRYRRGWASADEAGRQQGDGGQVRTLDVERNGRRQEIVSGVGFKKLVPGIGFEKEIIVAVGDHRHVDRACAPVGAVGRHWAGLSPGLAVTSEGQRRLRSVQGRVCRNEGLVTPGIRPNGRALALVGNRIGERERWIRRSSDRTRRGKQDRHQVWRVNMESDRNRQRVINDIGFAQAVVRIGCEYEIVSAAGGNGRPRHVRAPISGAWWH